MKILLLLLAAFSFFAVSAIKPDKKADKKYYDETLRPQFHFTAEKGGLSNPNGLVYYGGEYHLFYQFQPDTIPSPVLQWGHAVSKDLVRWEHLAGFNVPDAEGKGYCTPSTGCAVVDEKNLTGLQQGEEKTILLFYSGRECGQCLAYSNDKGRTWKLYEKNPLIPLDKDGANGPKIFYHSSSGKWVMTIFRLHDNDISKQGISIYTSGDLLHWEFQSHTAGFNSSADLYPLTLEDGNQKWVLSGRNNEYQAGSFDGNTFTAETKMKKQDNGKNFQTPHVWTNLADNKVIQIAWMRGGKFPGMPFDGQMSFPCELSLKNSPAGPVLCRKPVEGIVSLHDKDLKKTEKNIIPGIKGNLIGAINGDALHIKAKFDQKTSDGFGFIIRNGKKSSGTILKYEPAKKMLDCLGRQILVEPKNGKIEMEILIDRASIEVFANGGESNLSSCFIPENGENDLILWTQGGELFVDQIEVYTLNSAWGKRE